MSFWQVTVYIIYAYAKKLQMDSLCGDLLRGARYLFVYVLLSCWVVESCTFVLVFCCLVFCGTSRILVVLILVCNIIVFCVIFFFFGAFLLCYASFICWATEIHQSCCNFCFGILHAFLAEYCLFWTPKYGFSTMALIQPPSLYAFCDFHASFQCIYSCFNHDSFFVFAFLFCFFFFKYSFCYFYG